MNTRNAILDFVNLMQGMSFLAGNLLLYMDPYPAFLCFANLLHSPIFLGMLKMDHAIMGQRYDLLDDLLKDNCPDLYRYEAANSVAYVIFLCDLQMVFMI